MQFFRLNLRKADAYHCLIKAKGYTASSNFVIVTIRSAFVIFTTETSGIMRKKYHTEGYLQCHPQLDMEKKMLLFGNGTGRSHQQNGWYMIQR